MREILEGGEGEWTVEGRGEGEGGGEERVARSPTHYPETNHSLRTDSLRTEEEDSTSFLNSEAEGSGCGSMWSIGGGGGGGGGAAPRSPPLDVETTVDVEEGGNTGRVLRINSHCNTLQHTATHCNTLQHTATHCNTLQRVAPIERHRSLDVEEGSSQFDAGAPGGGAGRRGGVARGGRGVGRGGRRGGACGRGLARDLPHRSDSYGNCDRGGPS